MLTRSGQAYAIATLALFLLGWGLGYKPLLGIGIAFFLVLAIAILWVLRRPVVSASRTVHPERVRAGQYATSDLKITNRGRRRTNGGVARESFGAQTLSVTVPSLSRGESATITHDLPTERRGVYQVGPLLVDRSDPFGLIRTAQRQQGNATLYVHPRIHELDPFPSGLTRDLDGPSSGEAPEGGITFQNLRPYVDGDDLRLVHWRSFAKSDELMVRHNVDTHQPRSLVLLDTRAAVHNAESFENAVSVAASIVHANLSRRFPVRLRTTDGRVFDHAMGLRQILDYLAAIRPMTQGSVATAVLQSRGDPHGVSLTLVTGECTADDLRILGPLRNDYDAITIARFGERMGSRLPELPGTVLMNAASSQDFAKTWNLRVRR